MDKADTRQVKSDKEYQHATEQVDNDISIVSNHELSNNSQVQIDDPPEHTQKVASTPGCSSPPKEGNSPIQVTPAVPKYRNKGQHVQPSHSYNLRTKGENRH